ncbi:MAG: cupin domain-containing protein [Candidatus Bathyarchaeota archaeon]|nr:cupin domain-containing protein [Candidatus Bathyarchaeota archaeon]
MTSRTRDRTNINTSSHLYMLLEDRNTLDKAKSKQACGFPTVITDLPEADMPFQGVKAWILQGEKHQLIFFEMQPTALVPEHSHNYPQWGMVIEGKMKLTINGKTKTIKKGDDYLIPAQAKHQAKFLTKTRVIDFFSEKTRYKTKTAK